MKTEVLSRIVYYYTTFLIFSFMLVNKIWLNDNNHRLQLKIREKAVLSADAILFFPCKD